MKLCCERSKKYIFESGLGFATMICDYRGQLTGEFCDDPEDTHIEFCPFCGEKL